MSANESDRINKTISDLRGISAAYFGQRIRGASNLSGILTQTELTRKGKTRQFYATTKARLDENRRSLQMQSTSAENVAQD